MTGEPAQLHLQARCPRCGRSPFLPLADCAAKVMRSHVSIRDRKLAVPDQAMDDLAEVAAALRCRAGLCGPSEAA